MRRIPMLAATLLVAALSLPQLACQQEEGPAERAGRALDEAAEDVGDLVRDEGPLEEAGREADEAVEEAKKAFEDEN